MTNNLIYDSSIVQTIKFIDDSTYLNKVATLILDSSIGGTTYASDLIVKIGEYVAISAVPEDGYLFNKWLINGIEYITNPLSVKMDKDKEAIAYFLQSGYVEILNTFNSIPVNKGNSYYFGDHSAEDNDVLIKNQRCINPAGRNDYGQFANNLTWFETTTNPWTIEFEAIIKDTANGAQFFGNSRGLNLDDSFAIYYQLGYLNIQIKKSGTTDVLRVYWSIQANNSIPKKYRLTYDGNRLANGFNLYINGELAHRVKVVDNLLSNLTTTAWVVNYGANPIYYSLTKHYRISAWKSVQPSTSTVPPDYFNLIFNHGQGNVIYDLVGNNHVTWYNLILATFWNTVDAASQPYELTEGTTIYTDNAAPIDKNKYMWFAGDVNFVISGYTRKGFYLAGSGVMKGLPNTYTLVGNSEVPAGDYTADQIADFVNSDLVQVTQNENAITKLILKQ